MVNIRVYFLNPFEKKNNFFWFFFRKKVSKKIFLFPKFYYSQNTVYQTQTVTKNSGVSDEVFERHHKVYLDFFLGGENRSVLLALEPGDCGPANLDTGVPDLARLLLGVFGELGVPSLEYTLKAGVVNRDPVAIELRGEFKLEDDEGEDAEYKPPTLTSTLTKALDMAFLNLSPADTLRGDAIKLRVALRISSVIRIRTSG